MHVTFETFIYHVNLSGFTFLYLQSECDEALQASLPAGASVCKSEEDLAAVYSQLAAFYLPASPSKHVVLHRM